MMKFIQEIRRRSVFSVGTVYVIAAWLLLQVADVVLPIYNTPAWMLQAFTTLLFLGFPVALLLAWAYDLTPMGVKRADRRSNNNFESTRDKALAMPTGPSIAVVSFRNLGGDADQELFAQAMTNDIISGLTQSSSLRVVSSASTAPDTERDNSPASLGRELGVRYLLQGSVNKIGEQLRITAQLTDTNTNLQMWSANYDEKMTATNLFSVQDNIREQIVATLSDLHGVIFSSETEKNVHRPTDSLNAYECLSVALAYDKYQSEEYHLRARESLERAVKIDPEFDQAWSHLSWIYTDEVVLGHNPLPNSMERALDAARRAVELAPNNYHNHWLLSRVHYFSGERDLFFAESEKALSINSNDGTTVGLIGCYTAVSGEWEHGVALIEKAKVLNPRHPDYYHMFMSAAELHRHNYSGALGELRKMTIVEWQGPLLFLISTSALTGNLRDASRYLEILNKIQGGATLGSSGEYLRRMFPYADELVTTLLKGLKKVMSSS